MRIAIDAHMVGQRETGNETYTINLLRGLVSSSATDTYQVLTPTPDRLRDALALPPQFEIIRVRPSGSMLRIPVAMPLALRSLRSQVLHVSYVAPPRTPCPTVVTVHDLSYLVYPNSVTLRTRLVLSVLVPFSVRKAARVIAVSAHTKCDLVERYGLLPDKVTVVYEAAAPTFHRIPDPDIRPLPGGVREPFVLAVGNLDPRKNLERLIIAFGELAAAGLFPGQLVLVGKPGSRADSVRRLARERGLEGRVVLTGYVTDAQLNLLYNRAALFVYPSLYEGFGLPPLEAMRCGCPVVASNASAIPEVLGDAALLVDPKSHAAIADAMKAVLTTPQLAERLRAKGAARAAGFSWEKTAVATRAVYAEACRLSEAGAA